MNERDRAELQRRFEQQAEFFAGMDVQRERARELPRKLRRSELERIDQTEQRSEQTLDRMETELCQMPPVEHAARRELAAAEQVLDERLRAAVLAARLVPPAYITWQSPSVAFGGEHHSRGVCSFPTIAEGM